MGIFNKPGKEPTQTEPATAPVTNNGRAERKAARAERRAARAAAAPMGAPQPQEGATKPLRGHTPKANTANATEQEAKQFERMTYKESVNLFNSNPQQYHKLAESAKGGKQ